VLVKRGLKLGNKDQKRKREKYVEQVF